MNAKKSELRRSVTMPPHAQSTTRFQTFTKLAALSLLVLLPITTVRGQSALDGFDPNANGPVVFAVSQPDGKILISGDFTTVLGVTRNRMARLNPDGTLDMAFDPNPNDYVTAMALQPDGKVLVGGNFTSIGGQARNRMARVDATTGLADSFDPNAGHAVRAIAVQVDGRILAGGDFFSIGGQPRRGLARLDPATGLADSFDANANGPVERILLQPDGKILVSGLFQPFFGGNSIGGQPRDRMARLDPVTGLADSFDPSPSNNILTLALQADGKVLAGGMFGNIGGQPRNRIARLDATTGLADSFNPDADDVVYSIVVQADGKILVGGLFNSRFGQNSIGGQQRNYIARLDPTTGLADSFDPNADDYVYVVVQQADGKIVAGGEFAALAPTGGPSAPRNRIARLETDGRLDQTLNLNMAGSVFAIAVQPDGKTLIGGSFNSVLGVPRSNFARLNTDGTLDTGFNPSPNQLVNTIAVQPDGKILIGGHFFTVSGVTRDHIARLNTDGMLDMSFDPGASDTVFSIALQADGKIVAGGIFFSIGGRARGRIARLDPVTGLADSFNPGADNAVYSIVVQADGKILAGGLFSTVGGQMRSRIARLDPTTGLVDSFNANTNGFSVLSIAVQPDGKILAGGEFTGMGGQPRRSMARLNTDGLADSFNPNPAGVFATSVDSIALQADGRIVAGGNFVTIGGQTRNHIARLDPTTGLADSFAPNASGFVDGLAVQADGKILAGGVFSNIGGQPRSGFARLSNDTAALQNLAVTQTSINWTRDGSSPQFARVTFEGSNDNLNYTPLGSGTATGSNWILAGLNLPTGQNLYIRARGRVDNRSESLMESVRSAFLVTPSNLGNISTRLRVETGDNVLIGGFIVTGTQPKKIIVRAIGPSLPLAGALADPVLELRNSSGGLIRSNDNWRDDPVQESEIIATGIPPGNDLESAIVETLPANGSAYTAIVRGLDNGTGIGVVEAYDLDQTVNSKLANISTRGLVQTGDDVLIGGLIVLGQNQLRVIVRAIGPSLPFPGTLADPTLNLHDGNGTLVASNNNWREDPVQESAIIATGIPPSDDRESAMVHNLTPGSYTAIVRGVNNTTGIAVVEAYGLN